MSINNESVGESFSTGESRDFRFFSNEAAHLYQNPQNIHPDGLQTLVFAVRSEEGGNPFLNIGGGATETFTQHVPPVQFLPPGPMVFLKNDDVMNEAPSVSTSSKAAYEEEQCSYAEPEDSSLVIESTEIPPNEEVTSSSGYSTSSTGELEFNSQHGVQNESGNVERGGDTSENSKTRPSASYVAMISQAILTSPEEELTLSDIYLWIETNYPFFKSKSDGKWKNSVRHALSLHDCFIKHWRPNHAKGHFWAINPIYKANFMKGDYRKLKKMRCISPAVPLHELYMSGAYYNLLPREQDQVLSTHQNRRHDVSPLNCLPSPIGYPSFYQLGLPLTNSQTGEATQSSSTPIASSPLALWQGTSSQLASAPAYTGQTVENFGGCYLTTPGQIVPRPPTQPRPDQHPLSVRNMLYKRLEEVSENPNFFQVKD